MLLRPKKITNQKLNIINMALIFLLALTKIYPCRKIKKICHLTRRLRVYRTGSDRNKCCLFNQSFTIHKNIKNK